MGFVTSCVARGAAGCSKLSAGINGSKQPMLSD